MPLTSAPTTLSLRQIERLLQRRRRDLDRLLKKRSHVESTLKLLDQKIGLLGGTGGRGNGVARRPRNSMSLIEAIAQVLAKTGERMNVGEITDKVLASGYASTSPKFRAIVNQTLIKESRFVSTARGTYRLRKG